MVSRLISDAEKTRWVVVLAAAWLLLGVFPHDPWKPDEAYTFGIVWRMLAHGQWLVPNIGGQPFGELPALFHWSAALFAKLFSFALPVHDAARLASVAWVALALWGLGLSAREIYGKGAGRYAVLAFMGCVGLLERTHVLIPDNGLIAGLSFLLYGLVRARRPNGAAACWVIGLGLVVAVLTKGVLGFFLASAVIAALVWAVWPDDEAARRSITAAFRGAAFGLALIAVWIIVLAQRHPQALHGWLADHLLRASAAFTPLRFLKASGNQLLTLVWFALPALPLALWSLRLMQRGFLGGLQQFSARFLSAVFVVMFLTVALAPNARTTELMPLLLPLALLAYPGLDHLKRGHSGFLDWLGIFFFGAFILVCWLVWSALYLGTPRGFVLKQINAFQPGFKEPVRMVPAVLALVLTIVWFAMIRPARRTHKRALVNWTVGVTALWGVGTLLLLPYLDYGKSYRKPVEEIAHQVPTAQRGCVNGIGLGPSQRAMFDYLANIQLLEPQDRTCPWIIEQVPASPRATGTTPEGTTPTLTSTRPGERIERFVLHARPAP